MGQRSVLTGFDDKSIKVAFVGGARQDLLFDQSVGYKAKDAHFVLLADAVSAVLRLRVHHGVPVAVEEDHRVGRGEVQTQPTRSRTQQKDEVGTVDGCPGG